MEAKEEISDTDSGVILHSGPDSPTTVMKDVTTHTRAMKLKHQSLEDQLELCLLELKKLCIREAELTGRLSHCYPLHPGEKLPQVRRRIGAAFRLDTQSIRLGPENSALRSAEAELALELQIFEAARRLCHEEHPSKAVRRSRLQQCKRQEQKVARLQDALFRLRLEHSRSSPLPACLSAPRDPVPSDDSSLSDSAGLEEDVTGPPSLSPEDSLLPTALPSPPSPALSQHLFPASHHALPQTPESHRPLCSPCPSLDYESPPIRHSPWTESSLDEPYKKTKKSSSGSSKSSSPAVTPILPPIEACVGEGGLPLQFAARVKLSPTQSNSAPCTPEMQLRRQLSLRLPVTDPSLKSNHNRGRPLFGRRHLTDIAMMMAPASPLHRLHLPLYNSSSEDSNSEHSYAGSACSEIQPAYRYRCPSPHDDHGHLHLDHPHATGPHQHRNNYESRQHHDEYGSPQHPPMQYWHRHQDHHDNHYSLAFTRPTFYKGPQYQSSPSFFRGYAEEGALYPGEGDMERVYLTPAPPCPPPDRREYWYEEVRAPPQQVLRPFAANGRLSRAPSLREHPRHPIRGLPHQLVSEELKSWHQRNQFRETRPRSLDRQGAVRVKGVQGQESPLSQGPTYHNQAPQTIGPQRACDGLPVQWFVEDDNSIVSQV